MKKEGVYEYHIVGCGKVGLTLAEQLCQENHAITLIDTDQERLDDAVNSMDVQAVLGNGTSYQTQVEAGVRDADLLIAVTDQDELNMLSCLIARKVGNCQTIARVRNPGYYADIHYIKDDLALPWSSTPNGRRHRTFSVCCKSPRPWMWTPSPRARST